MLDLKVLGIQASAALGMQNLFSPFADDRLTTLLFHRFVFDGESRQAAKERLRLQLDWLRQQYTPVSLSKVQATLSGGQLPRRPILVTVDDARTDMLEIADEFHHFEIPVAVFVCVGWTAQAGPPESDTLLARVVSAIHWYRGPEIDLPVGDRSIALRLDGESKARCIDSLLGQESPFLPHLEELSEALDRSQPGASPRGICRWDELADLQRGGVELGCHSISHIRLAPASPARLSFETATARALLEAKLGSCSAFAYPYGTADAVNDASTRALEVAGFEIAFLTHSEFASKASDRLRLPRITMPDQTMSTSEFRARVAGGGIPMSRARDLLRANRSRGR